MAKLEDVAKFCMCYNFRKTSRAITQFYDKALEPSGLAITQLSLLVGLSISKSPTITKIASEMIMDRTTLTRNLNHLQKQGLIKIEQGNNDKRKRNISITYKGKKILAEAIPLWEKAQYNMIKKFGRENYGVMLSNLLEIIKLANYK